MLFRLERRVKVTHGFRWPSSSLAGLGGKIALAYDLHQPLNHTLSPKSCGAPIIFMHGLFGSKANNRGVSKALARDLGRPVYAIDLRNHGDSDHHPKHDYTAMAQDVEGFIYERSLGPVTLIGHSMGAKTAMAVALRSPYLVKNFVSVDNAPVDVALHSDFANYVRGMRKIEEKGVVKRSEADEILKEFEESLPIRQFLLANLEFNGSTYGFRIPLETLASALGSIADFPFNNPDVAKYEKPALFLRGTKSRYVPDGVIPLIGRFFPRFVLKDIEAGHWLISENPKAFQTAVVEFLEDEE
ncbi:MAG: hypothetical protein M1839_001222 [Geoglossum umbratile]|nr:MAG: hypothetical protein M1839_001222 [Geoglossum umbratile]